MIVPIIITVPFGDGDQREKTEERKAYEEKVIHKFGFEGISDGHEYFYDEFNFYPYKNPNPRGKPLSDKQLYDLLHDEMDFFLPEMESAAKVGKEFSRENRQGSSLPNRNYRTQFVPYSVDHRSKEVVIQEGEERWCRDPYVVIADDPDCVWGKFFYIDEYDCKGRLLRKYKKEGQDVGGILDKEVEEFTLGKSDEFWVEMEGDVNDPPEHHRLEHVLASRWLGLEYSTCFMYGIESSYMEVGFIPAVIDNLGCGNLFFHELMPEENSNMNNEEAAKEVQKSLEKMEEEDPNQYFARLKINSTNNEEKNWKAELVI
ncbi:uncharacterized protein FA14DRAFT_95357 [Meira miltonrushii]|uniref:Uncharacterized protein n=1 Tax=Meira miltonrushii TaxID=1280837 RepID=A0A316V1G6_9BASI|nr:uncharacterized protein FA14DRAFT_95357 [Meira miltonrushii]PWN31400.1 hypothetical protein FA14DRAFT_95357 [Meira miltonrushii]